ncbi:MAG: hypothetical protein ABW178_06810 [Pseudoxanthomonas sp.]
MTTMTDEQRAILQDIHDGKRVTGDRANWAVAHDYAQQAEDSDIGLTQAGREALDPT